MLRNDQGHVSVNSDDTSSYVCRAPGRTLISSLLFHISNHFACFHSLLRILVFRFNFSLDFG